MNLIPAVEADIPEIVTLANRAYRGAAGAKASWNVETGIVEGARVTEASLREDLTAKPDARLLLYRDPEGILRATAWLVPNASGTWYLGLLTVDPELQNQQLGRTLLAAAETYAQTHGANTIRMTVLNVRTALLAWYQRRGYAFTGESEPFPYGNDRIGKALRDDLEFLVLAKGL